MKAFFLVSCLCLSANVFAQSPAEENKPKTRLETFLAKDGTAIVWGETKIGTVKGSANTSATINAQEVIDAASGRKEYGISVEVSRASLSTRTNDEQHTSYIDYDEIESLIQGLDYISKVNKSSTRLEEYNAVYRTKGDLSAGIYSGEKGLSSFFGSSVTQVTLIIRSGTIAHASAYFKVEDIAKIKDLIVKAKAKLDEVKR